MRASDPDRTCEYGDADQWPNERKPIFFTHEVYGRWAIGQSRVTYAFPGAPRGPAVAWQATRGGRGPRRGRLGGSLSRGRRRQRVEDRVACASRPGCRVADDASGPRAASRAPRGLSVAWQTTPAGRGPRR